MHSRTCKELINAMGLIGQQWATLAPSHSETSGGSSGKIEIFSDPGPYDSSKAKFEEWWMMLRFSSWVVLFFSSLLFVPHLLSWGPFLMLTITTFLSWYPSHSPYKLSKPLRCSKYYCHTGGTLCLSLLSHGWLLLQPILLYQLHTPLTHSLFHDIPWCSVLTQQNVLPCSAMFFRLLSRSLLEYISPHMYLYLFYTLDLRNTRVTSLLSWVTCSKA